MPSKPGRKPGPGLPKGYKFKHVLERETARKHFESRIIAELDPLINAQLDLSKGLMVMFARERTGEPDENGKQKRAGRVYRVTDPEEISELLNSGGENGQDFWWLAAKDPDGKMLDSLMNRVFGRPREVLEVQPGSDVTIAEVIRALEPGQRAAHARALLRGQPIEAEVKRLP